MIYTFYSYKGGVGRTMALANVAELLCQYGLKVLIVDWDLESPDLEHYFLPGTDEAGSRPGLVDLIRDFKQVMSLPPHELAGDDVLRLPEIQDYCIHVYADGERSLRLLPAGKRVGNDFEQYAEAVRLFDWRDFYHNWEGRLFFKWLRERLSQAADVILINSCPGINEMSAVCTQQMASAVVLFCSSNQQGFAGTLKVAADLTDAQSLAERRRERVPVIIIPARIDDRAEAQLLYDFKKDFVERCQPYLPADKKEQNEHDYFWSLKVPNVPRYTFRQELITRPQGVAVEPEIVTAFSKIAQAMARLAPTKSALYQICGDKPASVTKPQPPVGVEPYRGLSPFLEEHAELFFGRTGYVKELLGYVEQGGLVAVIGQSGSGKSSLVQAGLLPKLRNGDLPGSKNWKILTFKPGVSPFNALATTLAPLLKETPNASRLDDGRLVKRLEEEVGSLGEIVLKVLEERPAYERVLLIVDQFEELYTLARDKLVPFLTQLVNAVESCPLTVVFTLRSDFYAAYKQYPPFIDAVRGRVVILGQMGPEELKDAVIKPAELMGVTFESGLDDRILADVGEEPGNLPLLQFALTRLWEERDGGRLTHRAYTRIGGVREAVALRAEAVYENLSIDDQKVARRIFTQLVQLSEDGRHTRRRAALTEFGEQDEKVQETVKALTDARLLVIVKEAVSGSNRPEEQIDVAHEALIQNWKRLQTWLSEDQKFLLWRQHLRRAVTVWKQRKSDRSALLRGTALREALDWQDERADYLSGDEKAYVAKSLSLRRWLRYSKIAAVVTILAVAALFIFQLWKARQSKEDIMTASSYYVRGTTAEQRREYEEALRNYDNAIRLSPELPDTYFSRANLYSRLGGRDNFQNAINDYTEYIKSNPPEIVAAYNGRGEAYRKLGQDDKALNDFNKALELNAGFAPALYNRAFMFAGAGQLNEAIENYTQVISLMPNFDRAYTDRGKVFYQRGKAGGARGDLQSAASDFNKAVELNPTAAEPYFYLGLLHAERDEYTKAVGLFTQAVELKPDYSEAYNERGQALDKLGQAVKAVADYKKAAGLNYAPAYYNLGMAYFGSREFDSAVEAFTQAIGNDPNNFNAHWHLGEAYAERGEHEKAIESYNKSIELKPEQVDVYFSRGVSYANTNQKESAIDDFLKFTKSQPSPGVARIYEARQYLERLDYRPPRSDVQIHLHHNERIDQGLLDRISGALKGSGFVNIRYSSTPVNMTAVRYFQRPFRYNASAVRDIIKGVFPATKPQNFRLEKFPSPPRKDTYGWIEVWLPAPQPAEPAPATPTTENHH